MNEAVQKVATQAAELAVQEFQKEDASPTLEIQHEAVGKKKKIESKESQKKTIWTLKTNQRMMMRRIPQLP